MTWCLVLLSYTIRWIVFFTYNIKMFVHWNVIILMTCLVSLVSILPLVSSGPLTLLVTLSTIYPFILYTIMLLRTYSTNSFLHVTADMIGTVGHLLSRLRAPNFANFAFSFPFTPERPKFIPDSFFNWNMILSIL